MRPSALLLVLVSLVRGGVTHADAAQTDRAQLVALGFSSESTQQGASKTATPCPGEEDGHELVGLPAKEWSFSDWVNGAPLSLAALRGRVVVVRFWTTECPYCERSMPALQKLATEFKDRPVTIVGAFHSKPADAVKDMSAPTRVAKSWGITFPLAFDRQWRTLRAWYLDGHHRHATSATFVIGRDGKIVHVHPGPVFYPSDVAADARQNRDFLAIRQAIVRALAQSEPHAQRHD
jgi:peroxiredoxin